MEVRPLLMEVYVVYYDDPIGVTDVRLFSTREKAQKCIDRELEADEYRLRENYDIETLYVDDEDYD